MLDPKGPSNDRSPARPNSGRSARTGHDTLAPGLALDQIGDALASFYDDLIAEGIPENLAALVRQVRSPESVPEPDPVAAAPIRKSGQLALVVEDDAATQELAVSLLDETELEVIGCNTAEEALAVMRDRGGDVALVFADIQLAGVMDGLQLARAVATLWPTARMVVTSGRRSPRPDLLPERVVFIPKPWRPQDVLVEAEHATSNPPPAVP